MSDALPGFFDLLKKDLCHRRAPEDLKKIFKDKYIYPTTGNYPVKYPQYEKSFAKRHNCVSLFDFETPSEDDFKFMTKNDFMINKWRKFFFDQQPVTPVFILNRKALANKLISNKEANEIDDNSGIIPHFEVLYPAPIPVNTIIAYLIICPIDFSGDTYEYFPHKGPFPEIFGKIDEFLEKHKKLYQEYEHSFFRQYEKRPNKALKSRD